MYIKQRLYHTINLSKALQRVAFSLILQMNSRLDSAKESGLMGNLRIYENHDITLLRHVRIYSPLKLRETPLTQCRSFVGFLYPSFLKTCPR